MPQHTLSAATQFKQAYRQFANDRPGQRFANFHRRCLRLGKGFVVTAAFVIVGTLLIVIGFLLGLIPGVPGIVLGVIGAALIASQFRSVSAWMDRAECRIRSVIGIQRCRLAGRRQAKESKESKIKGFGLLRWLRSWSHRRYLATLAILFGVVWVSLAIAPSDRGTWLLENMPVILLVIGIALFHKRLLLSRISYTLIFLFLCLHEVGAHFTYSQVPYDSWCKNLFGVGIGDLFGWERNHFDRLVHFLYGLLMAYPIREVFLRIANVRGFWGYFLPLDLTMSTSMFFELIEWAVAEIFGGGSTAYLATQGDQWDAQKDMALASLGALIAMTLNALVNRRFQRDFAREWGESLRVKKRAPLGEDEVERMIRQEAK